MCYSVPSYVLYDQLGLRSTGTVHEADMAEAL